MRKYDSRPVLTADGGAAYLLGPERVADRANTILRLHPAVDALALQTRRHDLFTAAVEMDAVLLADRLDLVGLNVPGAAVAREVATAVEAGATWSVDRWVEALDEVARAANSLSPVERAVLEPVADVCRRDAINLAHSAQVVRVLGDAAAACGDAETERGGETA